MNVVQNSIRNLIFILAVGMSIPGIAQETYDLRWKLPPGARLRLATHTTTQTETTTTDQNYNTEKETESEKEDSTLSVQIQDVRQNGNLQIQLSYEKLQKKSIAKDKTITFFAHYDAQGRPQANVSIETQNPILKQQDVKELLHTIAMRILELKTSAEITPQGTILSSRIHQDPFQNLPARTKITKAVGNTIRRLISPEDISQTITAEVFTQLPPQPVRQGESWPVKRNIAVMGLDMDGKGSATLDTIHKKKGVNIAVIHEKITYKVSATRFSRLMKEAIEGLMRELGAAATLEVDFQVDQDLIADSYSSFNIDDGYNMETTWKEFVFPMRGSMTFNIGGNRSRVKMNTRIKVDSTIAITLDPNSIATQKKTLKHTLPTSPGPPDTSESSADTKLEIALHTLQAMQNTLDNQQKFNDKLQEQVTVQQRRVFELQAQVVELTEELNREKAKTTQLESIRRRKEELIREQEEEIAALQRTLQKLSSSSSLLQDPNIPARSSLPIRGEITEVHGDLAALSVGSASGVRESMEFHIIRGDQYLGNLKIMHVESQQAVGKISRPQATIVKGDKVSTGFD